ATSDTYDKTGKITPSKSKTILKKDAEHVLKSFIGKQKQLPPMFSAKKVKGKKLYELARAGKEVNRKKFEIEIYDLKPMSSKKDLLKIRCKVSSGTYIRTLAHDIGQKLGTGAYLKELNRTSIGDFKIKDAIAPNKLTKSNWQKYLEPMKTVLVSGTFDGVHEGHKNYFQQARKLGHRLICVVAQASIVKKIKGKYPKLTAKERIKLVKQCTEIDQVFLGSHGSDKEVFDFIALLKPDIIALGYDQKAYTKNLKQEMKKRGLSIILKRLKPFKPETYKNSRLNGGQARINKKVNSNTLYFAYY
ncbi:MAG: adenylyltransferase/cytidyltransferase family protein, partial [Patescibacteria group bacterium]|nr:adenylyltransferase/cytidyltransferase family protein [Patescibacteria group bacterium]